MDTLITFVRHGRNNFARAGSPWHPGPRLNKQGKEQAEKTGKFLSKFAFDAIISSDMNRAKQTAEIIGKYQKKNKAFRDVDLHHQLAEHDEIIYLSRPRPKSKFKTELAKAESTIKFFNKLLLQNKGKKILIVSHGNAIRACVGTALGYPLRKCPEQHLLNCSLSSFAFRGTKLKGIFYINSVDHYRKMPFKKKFVSINFIADYATLDKNKTNVKKNKVSRIGRFFQFL